MAYVEADVTDPDRSPPMEIPWTPRSLYIPSRPSAFKSFSTSAERIMEKLEDVEVEKVVLNMDKVLRTLDAKLAALDVESANAMIRDLQVSAAELRTALKASDPDSVAAHAREVLAQVDGTLARLQRVIDGGQYDLEMTLENFRVTSENLRDLTDTARSYPSYLILGQPPDQAER